MSPSSLRVEIKNMWHSSGSSSELLDLFSKICDNDSYWKQMKNDVWLIYICCLLETEQRDIAVRFINKYYSYHRSLDFERFLPLSNYLMNVDFSEVGLVLPPKLKYNLTKSDKVFLSLKRNSNVFFDLVKNKTVAIVGNAGCELGQGKGEEIDSHDVVIRFNNYKTEGFENDYGLKTNIWVRGSAGEDIKYRNPSDFDLVMWEADYNHFMVHFDNLETLYSDLSLYPLKISNFDEVTHNKLRKISGLEFPSTGILTVWAVYLAKGNLNNVDVYGFSFINNNYSDTDHYYGETSRLAIDHDFENEIKFMHNFYNDHKRVSNKLKKEDVTIFISCHKDSEYVQNCIFKPIQVGTSLSSKRLNMIHDDEGDNISFKNKSYCELTAQYWAWKNYKAKYYGFLHYSRYFNFTETIFPEIGYNNINVPNITDELISKYGWTDDQILECISGYDVITTFSANTQVVQKKKDVYENYCSASYLHEKDLLSLIQIINEKYPKFAPYTDQYLLGQRAIFCNMYILRSDIFYEYCQWLFDILDEFVNRTNMSLYTVNEMRTPGHLSERMFGIYLLYLQNERKDLRIKQLQKVCFTNPRPSLIMQQPKDHIPIVFSCNERYLPYLGVTIQSIVDNSTSSHHYDLYVLHSGISAVSQEKIVRQETDNVKIAFIDISSYAKEVAFHSNIDYISIETFFRFIIPDIFPHNDKILYIDCDLVVCKDIAELYSEDVDGYILGAVRQINSYEKIKQISTVLKIPCYEYINAGVLLINLKEFIRNDIQGKAYSMIKAGINYPTGDQDLLNILCNKKIKYLDQSWNCPGPIYESMKKDSNIHSSVYTQLFEHSCINPGIVHYMTSAKPWDQPERIMSNYFWHYARNSPFYEEIIFRKIKSIESKINSAENKKENEKVPFFTKLKHRLFNKGGLK